MKTNALLSCLSIFAFGISFGQIVTHQQSGQPQRNLPQSLTSTVSNSNLQISGGTSHHCKTTELNEQYYSQLGLLNEFNTSYYNSTAHPYVPVGAKTPGVNTISVIFHVVHNPNNPAENVSNAAIMALFAEIQQDFSATNPDIGGVRTGFGFTPADANINFCLATQTPAGVPLAEPGVIRVSTTEGWYDSDNGEENKMKSSATGGSNPFNRNNYLNIWICDISNGASSGTAGYAYRPTPTMLPSAAIDGIVIDYNLGVNNEHVTSHEIGHYLGLDHTWGGSGGCGNDDGFADTPNTAGPSFNYPGSCGPNQQTCSGTQTQYENFMDYANCTCMFTTNQANYMLSILHGIRSSLLLSPGCDPVNAPPVVNFIADIPDPIVIPVGGSVMFTDQSTNSPTAWTWNFNGGAANSSVQNPSITFNTVGTYNVTLTASNAFGSGNLTKNAHVQVVAAASGTSCDTLRNYNPASPFYTLTGAVGYLMGNTVVSGFNVLEWAEPYTAPATTQIKRLEFAPARVSNGGGNVIFKVYANNAGNPGAVLASETVPLADLVEDVWNAIDFTTPASVTGSFFVGYQVSYANAIDTFALYTNYTSGPGTSYTYMNIQSNGWFQTSAIYTNAKTAFILDVLTSNGDTPEADLTWSDIEICQGGVVSVNGSSSLNTTNYYWQQTNDPPTVLLGSSTIAAPTFTFATAGNYRIYLFADGSCETDGIYLPITVNTQIAAVVTPTATTCGSNNGIITVTSPTGGDSPNYTYSINGTTFSASNTFTNLAAGNYTVYIQTPGDNCERTYPVTIGTSTPFVATVSANSSVCPGNSATITASGGASYQWFDGATALGSTASINVSPASTTQYSCVVTNGLGCQSTVYTTVNVYATPSLPIITPSGPTTFCAGADVDLSSSYATNNSWSTTETSSTITVSTSGSYTVQYTSPQGCSVTSAPILVTVNAAPSISSGTILNPTTCATTTGSIQVSGTGTGNISWTGTASGTSNGVIMPHTINGLAAGSYNITFTNAGGCISNTLNQSLTDPTPPANPVITPSGATTFCNGNSVVLTSSQAIGNTWSNSSTNNAITVTTSGTYSVTYTDGNGCSASSTPVIVTVNNNPATPTITPSGATTFCEGSAITLTSSQGTGNMWSTTATSQTINVTTSNTYSLTYTNVNGCVSSPATIVITVNPAPLVDAGTNATYCEGESIVVNGSGALSYSWDNGVTNGVSFIATPGVTTYTVTGTDINNCSATDMVTLTVNANPLVNAGADIENCGDATVTLNGGGAVSYTWDNGVIDGVVFTAPTGTTTYTVTGMDANNCFGTDMIDVTIYSLPTVTMAPFTNSSCVNHPSFALNQGSPAGGIYSGTGVSGGNFDPSMAGIGTFPITYTYTDGNGCENSAVSSVTVDGCASIDEINSLNLTVFPNPTNDHFSISLDGQFDFAITDMHGKLIYKSEGIDNITISSAEWTNGIYFIEVNAQEISKTVKIVKHH